MSKGGDREESELGRESTGTRIFDLFTLPLRLPLTFCKPRNVRVSVNGSVSRSESGADPSTRPPVFEPTSPLSLWSHFMLAWFFMRTLSLTLLLTLFSHFRDDTFAHTFTHTQAHTQTHEIVISLIP